MQQQKINHQQKALVSEKKKNINGYCANKTNDFFKNKKYCIK